jgi:hypothetical protein
MREADKRRGEVVLSGQLSGPGSDRLSVGDRSDVGLSDDSKHCV